MVLAPAAPILYALKNATQPYHHHLESHLSLLEDNLTRQTYRQLLQQFYGVYAPMESALTLLAKTHRTGFDYTSRWKRPLQDVETAVKAACRIFTTLNHWLEKEKRTDVHPCLIL